MKISYIRSLGTTPQTPAPVVGVVATVVSSTEIDLSWTAIAGAQNYTVRIFGNPVVTQPGTSVNFTMLTPSTTYTFTVAAINSFGEGLQSAPVSATTLQNTVGGFKVATGHYAQPTDEHGGPSDFDAAQSALDGLVGTHFRGIQLYTYINDIDSGTFSPSFGTLTTGGLGRWKALLDHAAAQNQFVSVNFYTHGSTASTGNITTSGPGVLPTYMKSTSNFTGAYLASCAPSTGLPDSMLARWTAGGLAYWKMLIDAYSALDGHPALAWFMLPYGPESDVNQVGASGAPYNLAQDEANTIAIVQYARSKMPNTLLRIPVNFSLDTDAGFYALMAKLAAIPGVILGSSDPEGNVDSRFITGAAPGQPGAFTRQIKANELFRGQTSPTTPGTFPDLRGSCYWASEVQLIGWRAGSTMTPIQMFQQNQGIMGTTCVFQCWQMQESTGTAAQKFSTGQKPYVISIAGATAKGVPTGGGGNTNV